MTLRKEEKMSNWKKYKLTELGVLARGKSKHRPRDASFLYGGPYPFIQTGDIKEANHRIYNYRQTYSAAGLQQSKLWPKDTLCITIAANIADTAILNFEGCFPDSVLGFIGDKSICDIEFIEYLLQHYKKEIQSHSIGSVQDNINLGTFERVEFNIPPLSEQQSIAEILSALDDKIELNLQMNKTLEEMANALYKHWFVDFGPFKEGKFIESELGMIPEGWEVVTMNSMVEFINGYAFKSSELLDEPEGDCYSVFKMGNIKKGGGLKPDGTKSYFKKENSKGLEKYILKRGDLLMSMTDMKDKVTILGHTALMNEDDLFIVNQRVGLLRLNNTKQVGYSFLYILTNNREFIYELRSKANSGVQVNLSTDSIKNSKFVIGPTTINKSFNDVVSPLFEKIFLYSTENETLKNLRDYLLPKLISGEIRVKEADKAVKEIV